jgi:ariadne-1
MWKLRLIVWMLRMVWTLRLMASTLVDIVNTFLPRGKTCESFLDVSDVQRINGDIKSNEYCEILSKKTIQKMDIRYCSKRGCENGQLLEDESVLMKCSLCQTKTCINCNAPRHTAMTCRKYKISKHGKAVNQMEKDITLNENLIKIKCIQCPNCKLPIRKNEGCNHLT